MKTNFRFLIYFVISIVFIHCARKGRPDGGPKDEDAPIMVTATPPYKTINFDKQNIKIYFDEYIVLKNLQKQLVVSPPLKYNPIITPQGTPSKNISIKILDTLKANTTYTFNFGNAVQDNNEKNTLESFKYVFSTGSYIDSLTLKGKIADAVNRELDDNSSVLLYKIDSVYTDSIIYKQKPNYVTNTLDSVNFNLTNIQKGKYLLLALKDISSNYLFNPKEDKIGFYQDTIQLPRDSVISEPIRLFTEVLPFKFKKGKEVTKGKIEFGFEGEQKDFNVTLLSKTPEEYKAVSAFEKDKDTLNYWFTPIEADSLNFKVSQTNFSDTITVKLRKKKIDSLTVFTSIARELHLNDTLFFKSNNPIVKIDSSKFTFVDKDTVAIPYQLKKVSATKYAFLFDKKPSTAYKLKVLPEAFNDLFNTANDSINISFNTKKETDYGSIIIALQRKQNYPIIIELINDRKEIVKRTFVAVKTQNIAFNLIEPSKYTIRYIVDKNDNKKWDTGNFLLKRQPEKIGYHPDIIPLRANWVSNINLVVE